MQFTRSSIASSITIDLLEELPNALRVICGPELLESIGGARCLGLCLPKPMLPMSKPSLQLHRAGQNVRVVAVSCVQLGLFDVGVRVVETGFVGEQPRHTVSNPKW